MAEVDRWMKVVAFVALALGLVACAQLNVLPVDDQPVDAAMYVDLSDDLLTGDGYSIDTLDHTRHPPGLPIMLIPFVAFGAEGAFPIVAAMGLVFAVWLTAWRIGGPVAATVGSLLVATSGHLAYMGGFLLSDTISAAVVVLAVLAWHERRPVLAGVLLGWSSVLRLVNVGLVVAGTVAGGRRVARGAAPIVAALAGFWLVTRFGHKGEEAGWSLSFLWSSEGMIGNDERASLSPNLVGWPKVLLGIRDGYGGLMLPFVGLLGAFELVRRRAWFPLSIVATTVAVYLPYFAQCERFMLPAGVVLNIYVGVWIGRQWDRTHKHRGSVDPVEDDVEQSVGGVGDARRHADSHA